MARLKIDIGVVTDQLKAGLSRAKGMISGMASSLGGIMKFTGAGLVATLGYLAVKATGIATTFEQTSLAFKVMMGDGAKAAKLLNDLNKFSNDTPFTPEQVFAAGKQQLAFGFAPEDIIGNLTMIGDIAAGTGKDFNELGLIFGKVFSKGKMDSQDLNQMAEAGIPIIKTLAKMYNSTGAEIYDMASKGKLGFDDLKNAFAQMTGEGGTFSGMMKQQAQTFNGIMSTLKGNIADIGRSIAESWLPALKEAAAMANKIATEMQAIREERNIVATSGNGAVITRSSFYRAKLNEKGVGNSTLRDNELFPFITPDIEYEANRIFGKNGTQISREAFAAKISGSKFTAAPAPGGRSAKAIKETASFAEETARQHRAESEQYDKDEEKIGKINAELERKKTIQELINQGKKREAVIQNQINAAEEALGRKLRPDESSRISEAAGNTYNATIDAGVQERIRALREELGLQQMKNAGKLREAFIQQKINEASKEGELTEQRRAELAAAAGALFDAEANNKTLDAQQKLNMAAPEVTNLQKVGGNLGQVNTSAMASQIAQTNQMLTIVRAAVTSLDNKIRPDSAARNSGTNLAR